MNINVKMLSKTRFNNRKQSQNNHNCELNGCHLDDCCDCFALLCKNGTYIIINDDDALRYCIKCLIKYVNNNNNDKYKIYKLND